MPLPPPPSLLPFPLSSPPPPPPPAADLIALPGATGGRESQRERKRRRGSEARMKEMEGGIEALLPLHFTRTKYEREKRRRSLPPPPPPPPPFGDEGEGGGGKVWGRKVGASATTTTFTDSGSICSRNDWLTEMPGGGSSSSSPSLSAFTSETPRKTVAPSGTAEKGEGGGGRWRRLQTNEGKRERV